MFGRRVVAVDSAGSVEVIGEYVDRPGGIGFLPDGTLLVAQVQSRLVLRHHGGEISVHADLSVLPADHLNDMIVAESGVAYVAVRSAPVYSAGEGGGHDSIVAVDPDGSIRVAATGLTRPNGMAITADGRTLIVAETPACRLTAYEIDSSGGLANRRTFAETGDLGPDGICVDEEDAVWFGAPLGGRFVRVLANGAVDQEIEIRKWAIACVLGGPDHRTLFLATATVPADDEGTSLEDRLERAEGSVERVFVAVGGARRR
jgi:sugar lactone lactonase YvrE